MAEKKAKSRQKAQPDARQTPVEPRWKLMHQSDSHVVINRADVLDKNGVWDKQALWDAKEAFPGKDIVFSDEKTSQLFVDRKRFEAKQGGKKLADAKLKRFGKALSFYESPSERPERPAPAVVEKPKTRLGDLKDIKVTKIWSNTKKINQELAAQQLPTSKGDVEDQLRRHKKPEEGLTAKDRKNVEVATRKSREAVVREKKAKQPAVPKPKVVSLRAKHGSKWDGKKFLSKNQYISRTNTVRSESAIKMKARLAAGKARAKRLRDKGLSWLAKSKARSAKLAASAVGRQARDEINSKAQKVRLSNERASTFASRLRNQPGFGKTPVKLLMKNANLSGQAPGKRAVLSSMSHGEKYPARNLSSAGAFAASARGPQTLSSVKRPYVGSLGEEVGGKRLRVAAQGGSMFATSRTVMTEKFPAGGAGILFRIDAEQVIANLVQRYPAALAQAARETSDRIGRKMLDIVEPYVPKDTGLLYSSAETNVSQTAGGLVDMAGGEAYPADQMYGVSISYNAPYAELVYFDESKAHGAEYNQKHGTSEKGEKETARWIEKAFAAEGPALQGLLAEYARSISAAMNAAGIMARGANGRFVSIR